ncbi:MAG: tripartite tricarboxylate transporter substrate binding protein [Cupriavidus necator]
MQRRSVAILRTAILAAAGLALATQAVAATDYPTRPIRLIVPYAAGGGADTVARMLAQKLTERLGQQIIVENKPGAARQTGTLAVVKAAPDGYTPMMGTANLATNVPLFAKLPYDAATELAPVSLVTKVPVYLLVNADSPVKNVRELVALSKSTTDGLSYSTAGASSVPHLAGEMFCAATGTRILHIPYKGSSGAATALLGNQVNLSFDNLPPVNAYLKAGRVRALAVAMPKRSTLLPQVLTMAELGFPIEAYSWWGVLAPAGTPAPIIERLNREILAALKPAEMRERFALQGIEPVGSSPAEFTAHIRSETAKWTKAVKAAGIHPE